MPQQECLQWGGSTIAYTLHYGSGKSVRIAVHPDLTVCVTAPEDALKKDIHAKVHKRAAWIHKQIRSFEQFHPLQGPRQYVPGESHRYLGRQYRLKVHQGDCEKVTLHAGQIHVSLNSQRVTSANIKPLVESWLQQRAQIILTERFKHCCKITGQHPPMQMRAMKTRWGSCTKAGRIVLNQELIKASKDCIDYVIIHELCHLTEHNHSVKFWKLLETILPDWKERRTRLNKMADI